MGSHWRWRRTGRGDLVDADVGSGTEVVQYFHRSRTAPPAAHSNAVAAAAMQRHCMNRFAVAVELVGRLD